MEYVRCPVEYIASASTDPRWNLALEQYAFDCLDRSRSYFMLWQNDNTIVVGKNQNTVAEINNDFVREHNILVVRRLSGGGAVYHDLGNLNFTFITDADKMDGIDLHMFCVPIVETLRSFGVQAEISGRNDITVDGKKFSGNSQYIREGRVMHHGTIMFDSDLTMVSRALQVDREKILSKGIRSVVSRVTNLRPYLPDGITLDCFRQRLLDYLSVAEPLHTLTLTPEDMRRVDAIRDARYATWEWNYGRSPAYTDRRRQRFDGCGLIEVALSVEGGHLKDIQFFGDFFGSGDTSQLSRLLRGCTYRRETVRSLLETIDLENYIHNISAAQLAGLIVG